MPSHRFRWNSACLKSSLENLDRQSGSFFKCFRGELDHPPLFWSKIWVKYKLDKCHVHKMKRIYSIFQHGNCASFDSSKRWFQVRTISCGSVLAIGCLCDQASKNWSFSTSIISISIFLHLSVTQPIVLLQTNNLLFKTFLRLMVHIVLHNKQHNIIIEVHAHTVP